MEKTIKFADGKEKIEYAKSRNSKKDQAGGI